MKKLYFPNLNVLRFIAALLVVIHHIEQLKNIIGFDNYWQLQSIKQLGKIGVVLFFVLSGFLITYLLLIEKKSTKTVSIKDFYIRRILRIWPLYFLIFILSFLVLPHFDFLHIGNWSDSLSDNYNIKFLLYSLFLPHIALVLFAPVPFASQLWSIGVEEYFYLIWAPLIKFSKNIVKVLFIVITGYLGIKVLLKLSGFVCIYLGMDPPSILTKLQLMTSIFSIDLMAIGGIFAWIYYKRSDVLALLYQNKVQYINLFLIVALIIFGVKIPYINYEIYSLLFGLLILNLATNPYSVISLENKYFNYLGKISYGIYMFHPLVIVIVLKILKSFQNDSFILQYTASILFTLLISAISYELFEKYFLKKKKKFSKI